MESLKCFIDRSFVRGMAQWVGFRMTSLRAKNQKLKDSKGCQANQTAIPVLLLVAGLL